MIKAEEKSTTREKREEYLQAADEFLHHNIHYVTSASAGMTSSRLGAPYKGTYETAAKCLKNANELALSAEIFKHLKEVGVRFQNSTSDPWKFSLILAWCGCR